MGDGTEMYLGQLQKFNPQRPEDSAWQNCERTSQAKPCRKILWLNDVTHRQMELTQEHLDLILTNIGRQQQSCPACKRLLPKSAVFGMQSRIDSLPCQILRKQAESKKKQLS